MARRWTEQEDLILRRGYVDGRPIRAIAAELDRSSDSVSERRRTLSMPARQRMTPWTAREDAFLLAAALAGVPASVAAAALGRPEGQVGRRRRRLAGRRTAGRPFSAREDAAIRQCWSQGGDLAALAQALGRGESVVRERARRLGVHSPASRPRWRAEEDVAVRNGYRLGMTCVAIAAGLGGRTPTAVAARAAKLGLATFARRWTASDDRRLRLLAERHATVEGAARLLVRTPDAVRARARRLRVNGLASDPAARTGRPWTPDEDGVLRAHPSTSPAALGQALGRSSEAVAARLRKLDVRQAAHRSPHYRLADRDGLSPGELAAIRRELASGGPRRHLALAKRLGQSPATIMKVSRVPDR